MKENYRFYKNNANTIVIAEATFAGKRVKGYAKLSPDDTFDEEFGKQLAAARCNRKIAIKRNKRATKKLQEAIIQYENAKKNLAKMNEYYSNSLLGLEKADERIATLI